MIDLHLHLDGSLPPKTVVDIARHDGIELKTYDITKLKLELSAKNDCKSLTEYLEKFDLPLRVLQTKYGIEYATYALLSDLSQQGLLYAEIRFAPQLHIGSGLTQKDAVKAAIAGVNRAKNDFGFTSQLILCCMRGKNNDGQNLQTLNLAKEFLNKGVCAIDLAGDESHFATSSYKQLFETALKSKIPFTIHAGEAAGFESVADALKMGAVRIGHGINSINSDDVLNTLKNNKIIVETCLTSNLQTKAINSENDFPLLNFLNNGILATINTDNVTVSDTTLKQEYCKVKKLYNLKDEQLLVVALNAVDGAFINSEQKQILKTQIKTKFLNWINGENDVQ